EILSLEFDLVVGVDTGGDSIATKGGRGHLGRDQRMLKILRRTGLPLLHVVAAPGSDGEASFADLQAAFTDQVARDQYSGCCSLEPMLGFFRAFRPALSPTRTPMIILAAAEDRLVHAKEGRVVVPRGRQPAVPRSWLTTGFVLGPRDIS